MSKDESRITNNPEIMEKVTDVAKKATHSDDPGATDTINKIDEIVTILESQGKEREQGAKAQLHGNNKDYDDAANR